MVASVRASTVDGIGPYLRQPTRAAIHDKVMDVAVSDSTSGTPAQLDALQQSGEAEIVRSLIDGVSCKALAQILYL